MILINIVWLLQEKIDEKIKSISNPYYKDVDLTFVINGHREDFEQKVKDYYSEYSKVIDLKDKTNRLKHRKIDKQGNALLFSSQEQVKAAVAENTIKTGDFFYVRTSKKNLQGNPIDVPVLWTGKNMYYITKNNELTTDIF